jgi:tRNA(fMet)-specific endonuclease VapC
MAGLTYILDATVISDLFVPIAQVQAHIRAANAAGSMMILCQPTYYEVLRGLLRVKATRKLRVFQNQIVPLFQWTSLIDADWEQAAQYWADATSRGRQLSDGDLLLAAVSTRLDGIIVSSDTDFDALPVKREDWRIPPP